MKSVYARNGSWRVARELWGSLGGKECRLLPLVGCVGAKGRINN